MGKSSASLRRVFLACSCAKYSSGLGLSNSPNCLTRENHCIPGFNTVAMTRRKQYVNTRNEIFTVQMEDGNLPGRLGLDKPKLYRSRMAVLQWHVYRYGIRPTAPGAPAPEILLQRTLFRLPQSSITEPLHFHLNRIMILPAPFGKNASGL
jgi:hypothetical protein